MVGEGRVLNSKDAECSVFDLCAGFTVVATVSGDFVDVLVGGPVEGSVLGEVGDPSFLVKPADIHDHEATVDGMLAAGEEDAVFVELEDF